MKQLCFFAAALFTLTGCTNNEEPANNGPVPITVTASIGAETRAYNNTWEENDQIGITTERTHEGAAENVYKNEKYTTEGGDGKFTGATMSFHDKNALVDFYAYYPYVEQNSDVYTLSGTPGIDGIISAKTTETYQKNRKLINFLFSTAQVDPSSSDKPSVNFVFKHKMSKLMLKFKPAQENGGDITKITNYTIEGLKLNGTFNTRTGIASANGDTYPLSMDLEINMHDEYSAPPLILFPQEAFSVIKLTITTNDNQHYGCILDFTSAKKDDGTPISGKNELVAGYSYVYTINVKKTNLEVEGSTITNWNVTELSGEANLE